MHNHQPQPRQQTPIETNRGSQGEAALTPQWFGAASDGLDTHEKEVLKKASQWATQRLPGLEASTGEPLLSHVARATLILKRLRADGATRAAALLAVSPYALPTVESAQMVSVLSLSNADLEAEDKQLLAEFGSEILSLVQGTRVLLRLGSLTGNVALPERTGGEQKEMRRKMLLAMAADLRIVLMRLASRLQTLHWYVLSKTPCPVELARETLELYAPLANRLGIWQIKWEMEDLAFRFLEPDTYKSIAAQLEAKRVERETLINGVVQTLRKALKAEGVVAEVNGRPKHIYSIWNKMQNKNLAFDQLRDLRALRIIVDDERACYTALALVHALWTPVLEEFDDYISRPKPNGYRSLHTVVTDAQGRYFEIQIRTHEMHEFAEYGMAAHWHYKEAGARGGQEAASSGYDRKIAWMRQLLAQEASPSGDLSRAPLQKDSEPIYVLTPQARVIELPAGATPVDFAYRLHTDLGHRCRGAKVNGQMVPLQTRLNTGQTIEIITAKSGGPSRDWLNPQLGYLASPRARAKVRAWFNAIEHAQRISQGQTLVEKELQRLGKTSINQEQLAGRLGFASSDDLYVAAAKDEFSLRQIDQVLREPAENKPHSDAPVTFPKSVDSSERTGKSGVLVVGVDALLTQLARCCRPVPPDDIVGFVTRGRGVSIHRRDCPEYAHLAIQHPERLIDVDWGDTGQTVYPVTLSIRAPERPDLLKDLSEIFARLRMNVIGVNTQSRRSLAHMLFTVEVRSGEEIRQILTALNELSGVTATRQ